MKSITVAIVVVICVFATFTATVYFVNKDKEQEITGLREQVENLTSPLHHYVGDSFRLMPKTMADESLNFVIVAFG